MDAELREFQGCLIDGECKPLSRKIDILLRGIFGNFKWGGPRNWVGSAPEGAWSGGFGSMDKYHLNSAVVIILLIFWVVVNVESLRNQMVIYFAMLGMIFAVYAANNLAGQLKVPNAIPTEYLSAGEVRDLSRNVKIGVILTLFWMAAYYFLGAMPFQAVLPQSVTIQEMPWWMSILIIGVAIPFVEESFLAGFILPSLSKFGIFFGLGATSIARGTLHFIAFNASPFHILMSILWGLIVYPFVLKYKTKEVAIWGHISGNTATLLI